MEIRCWSCLSDQYHGMSDADVQALVAYLRSQPPVPHDTPPVSPNLLGAMLIGVGGFPTSQQPPITQPVDAPLEGTADHGQYLVGMFRLPRLSWSGFHRRHTGQVRSGRA